MKRIQLSDGQWPRSITDRANRLALVGKFSFPPFAWDLELIREALGKGAWVEIREGGKSWRVTANGCTCPEYRAFGDCEHRLAVAARLGWSQPYDPTDWDLVRPQPGPDDVTCCYCGNAVVAGKCVYCGRT